jgi:hypothetical protein
VLTVNEQPIEQPLIARQRQGGLTRAARLTPERRSEIARSGASARHTAEMRAFGSLPVGTRFNCNVPPHRGCFRKVATHGAFALLPNGTGQTHAQIPFEEATRCRVLPEKITPTEDAAANPEVL